MQRHSRTALRLPNGGVQSAIVFIVMLAILSALVWGGYTVMRRGGIGGITAAIEEAEQGADSGPSVTVGVTTGSPQSLDIRTDVSDAVEQALLGNVYETLVGRDENNQVQPGLASSWDVSADALTYTFHLNAGMKFSNGHTLDAQDVAWSLQQTVQNKYVEAAKLTNLAGVSNPDASTVTVTLSAPNPNLLWLLSGRDGIVYDSEANVDYASQAVGSGPFTVADFAKDDHLTLKRNLKYWKADGKAKSATVTLRYFSDGAAAADAVVRGEADALVDAPVSTLETLRAQGDAVTLTQGESTRKVLLGYNGKADSIFSEVHLRQGLRYVIDKQRIIDANGAAEAIGGPIPRLDPGYEDLTGLYPHDAAKAHSVLNYFGFRYRLRLVYPERYGQQIGDMIVDSLKSFGYSNVTAQMVDDAAWQTQVVQNRDFDMTIFDMDDSHDVLDLADPSLFLGYTDAQAEQLAAQAKAATNDQDYADRLKALGRRLSENAIADFLYVERPWLAQRQGVSGLPTNRTDVFLPLAGLAKA
ncbi:ABC transporter substrate-binding protein [Bifidobacterium avesanii]|uniref:ABC transporter substrate-binding protein n=1 Tax=Bifidobacterium avesanii TaxID=1798157 RepID=A0A7K3TF28_9BIFI|nr:ABC transporter substrate-binding protein [Bifidobacterium avesanii]KAB8287045.1 ABC transporter substrate-binding protein [Bifidobacterium avesanii]NEG77697.1 ABC transporter substrate-binding protein [Bifidobacterium avesanii]